MIVPATTGVSSKTSVGQGHKMGRRDTPLLSATLLWPCPSWNLTFMFIPTTHLSSFPDYSLHGCEKTSVQRQTQREWTNTSCTGVDRNDWYWVIVTCHAIMTTLVVAPLLILPSTHLAFMLISTTKKYSFITVTASCWKNLSTDRQTDRYINTWQNT